MVFKITQGVLIKVNTLFQTEISNPLNNEFTFCYTINIENQNEFPIQLIARSWIIKDSNCFITEVNGKGVVGEQPSIYPNQSYTYSSICNLKTEIGKMQGKYSMLNLFNKSYFNVIIPSFDLIFPGKLN